MTAYKTVGCLSSDYNVYIMKVSYSYFRKQCRETMRQVGSSVSGTREHSATPSASINYQPHICASWMQLHGEKSYRWSYLDNEKDLFES